MLALTPYGYRRGSVWDPFKAFDKEFFKDADMPEFKTDITDEGEAFLLEADLPGFKKEDIELSLKDNCLTITAQRNTESEEKDKKGNYIRRERSYGSYTRSFDVTSIDTEGISAEYNDGVLKLRLPKESKKLPEGRKIEIS